MGDGSGESMMTMEELVNKLASLQSERTAREIAADKESAATDLMIKLADENITSLEEERKNERQVDENAIGELDVEIKHVSAQIIDVWGGDKKTLKFENGTLKFRTSQSLVIENDRLVLEGLLAHTSTDDVATNYITGFKKTAVKKYMGVLPLPMGAARIDLKTTVKLEEEAEQSA